MGSQQRKFRGNVDAAWSAGMSQVMLQNGKHDVCRRYWMNAEMPKSHAIYTQMTDISTAKIYGYFIWTQ